jgi:hypothetical protein
MLSVVLCLPWATAGLARAGEDKGAITVGEEIEIVSDGPGKNCRGNPRIVCGKDSCLCVWREGWEGKNGGARIRAARVGPDGKLMDKQTLELAPNKDKDAPQERPRAAFCKDVYLVVWHDLRNGADYDVLAARVSGAGQLLDAAPITIAAGPHNQVLPDVAADGDGFLVVWQAYQEKDRAYHGYAARVDLQGKAGAPSETGIAPQPKVAWDGSSFLVSSSNTSDFSYSMVARLSTDGKPGMKPLPAMQRTVFYSLSAVPGKGWLLVSHRSLPDAWGWGGPGAIRTTFVTSDGQVDKTMPKEEPNPKPLSTELEPHWLDRNNGKITWPYGQTASAWDGKHSVVIWQRYHCSGEKGSAMLSADLYAMRVDGWKRVSDKATPVASGEASEKEPSLASDGAGKLWCVYEKLINDKTVLCLRMITSR